MTRLSIPVLVAVLASATPYSAFQTGLGTDAAVDSVRHALSTGAYSEAVRLATSWCARLEIEEGSFSPSRMGWICSLNQAEERRGRVR